MHPLRIYAEEWEAEPQLAKFDTSRSECLRIVDKVVASRADAVDDDPLGTAGQFAYIFGTRHTRACWKAKGWSRLREEGSEAVYDLKTGKKIIYQNVDRAGCQKHSPLARKKGSGARRLVDYAQGDLFSKEQFPLLARNLATHPLVWYFLVSVETSGDGERMVGAELSLPLAFKGDNFAGFQERIFIRPNAPWNGLRKDDISPGDDAAEFEPKISRK